MEVSAVIIARSGSVRIKQKSLLPFGKGTNLITHKIQQLKKSKLINRVIFGSDSDRMLNEAKQAGAEIFKRDDYFCDEKNCSINEVIHDMCSKFCTDVVLWSHCTNPLLSTDTYDLAITSFFNEIKDNKYDSLLSVIEMHEHLWGTNKQPLNYNPWQEKHPLAKSLPPIYAQDGGIFIQSHKNMLENKYFFGKKPFLFCIPENEHLDINNERDYLIAKILYEQRIVK